jgi:hypothetical protein
MEDGRVMVTRMVGTVVNGRPGGSPRRSHGGARSRRAGARPSRPPTPSWRQKWWHHTRDVGAAVNCLVSQRG